MSYLTCVVLPGRFCRGDTRVAFYHDTIVTRALDTVDPDTATTKGLHHAESSP